MFGMGDEVWIQPPPPFSTSTIWFMFYGIPFHPSTIPHHHHPPWWPHLQRQSNSRYVNIIIVKYISLYPYQYDTCPRFLFALVLGCRQWVFCRHWHYFLCHRCSLHYLLFVLLPPIHTHHPIIHHSCTDIPRHDIVFWVCGGGGSGLPKANMLG